MESVLGPLHTAAAVLALVVGGAQLGRMKGTSGHRRLGWIYAALMVGLNATALGIYRETGHWNLFHWLAVVSLLTLVVGLAGLAIDWRRWWPRHAFWMAGSYLGVVLAGLFQLAARIRPRPLGLMLAALVSASLAAWLFLHKVPADVRETALRASPPAP